MKARTADLEHGQQTVADLFDRLLKTLATRQTAPVMAGGWSYDLLQPNLYFGDLHPPEINRGNVKRWVGGTGILEVNLLLPRTLQYDLSIQVVDFALPDYEQSLFVRIDGQRHPWTDRKDRRYRTVIFEDPGAASLNLQVAVETGAMTDKDVTFSFSALEISTRG